MGRIVLNNNMMSKTAAPTINDTVDRNIESLATGLRAFAPATVNTVPTKAAAMPATSSHLSKTDGEVCGAKLIDGTKRNKQAVSTTAKLASESAKPAKSTPLLAGILE